MDDAPDRPHENPQKESRKDSRMERRSWMRWMAGGGLGAAAAAWFGTRTGAQPSHVASLGALPARPQSYGHGAEPPDGVTFESRRALLEPPPWSAPAARTVELWVAEQPVPIAHGVTIPMLTYNGTVPGPIIRCVEGDDITVRCRNLGTQPHTVQPTLVKVCIVRGEWGA